MVSLTFHDFLEFPKIFCTRHFTWYKSSRFRLRVGNSVLFYCTSLFSYFLSCNIWVFAYFIFTTTHTIAASVILKFVKLFITEISSTFGKMPIKMANKVTENSACFMTSNFKSITVLQAICKTFFYFSNLTKVKNLHDMQKEAQAVIKWRYKRPKSYSGLHSCCQNIVFNWLLPSSWKSLTRMNFERITTRKRTRI